MPLPTRGPQGPANDSPEALDAKVQEVDAEVAGGRQEEINAAAPEATEPLDPNRINPLGQIVSEAAGTLSGGQLQIPVVEVQGPQDALPPELFAAVMAMSAVTDAGPEALKKYNFDPTTLAANNAGLAEMANTISAMAADPKAVQAMNQPLEGGPEEAPPEEAPVADEEPETDEDEFEGLV